MVVKPVTGNPECVFVLTLFCRPLFSSYQYREVNTYLNRPIKAFVKKFACCPDSIELSDFMYFSTMLLPSEKCHIALLILEAKKQAEILYGVRAIEKRLAKS